MKHKSAGALYDEIADKYVQNRSLAFNDYVELPTVMRLAGNVKGKSVLDAGCGPGKHAKELMDEGAYVTGIDISTRMVQLAKENCGNRGEFFKTDLTRARFKPAVFDLIIASLSIIYCRNIQTVFKNFSRWLRPDGRLIFSIYHPVRYYEKIEKFDFSKSKRVWIKLHGYDVVVFNYYHPMEEYFDALHEAGLKVLKYVEPVLSRKQKGWREDAYTVPRVIVVEANKES